MPGRFEDLSAEAKQWGLRVGQGGAGTLSSFVPSAPRKPAWETSFPTAGETPRRLIRLLVEVVSKGGALALDLDTTRLEAMVRWLRVNGESLKGASSSPFDRMPFFGRATLKGSVLYLHLFGWPSGNRLRVPGLEGELLSVELLATHSPLLWSRSGAATVIHLPERAPDEAASVIKLTFRNPPRVQPFFIEPDEQGPIVAGVESCEIESRPGQLAFKENSPGRVFLTNWKRAIDVPSWRVRAPRDGRYSVEVRYAAWPASAGVVYTVTMKGQTVGMAKGIVESTGGRYQTLAVGDMQLDAGEYTLLLQPENKAGQTAMSLEKVILKRVIATYPPAAAAGPQRGRSAR